MLKGELIGLKEANKALKRLPEFAKDSVQQVMDVTAFQVSQKAKASAPVQSGALKRAIEWESRPRSLSSIVGIGSEAFYWKFIEYGTVKMAAHPFMRPAALSLEADHHARMIHALVQAANRVEREGP